MHCDTSKVKGGVSHGQTPLGLIIVKHLFAFVDPQMVRVEEMEKLNANMQ